MEETSTSKKGLTVIEYLQFLPIEIRARAIFNSVMNSNYEFNKGYRIDCIKKALVLSANFNETKEGDIYWWNWYDKIGIPEERKELIEPNNQYI